MTLETDIVMSNGENATVRTDDLGTTAWTESSQLQKSGPTDTPTDAHHRVVDDLTRNGGSITETRWLADGPALTRSAELNASLPTIRARLDRSSGMSVVVSATLPDSCTMAKITRAEPNWMLEFVRPPDEASIEIAITRAKNTPCKDVVTEWTETARLYDSDYNEGGISIYLNEKLILNLRPQRTVWRV